MKLKSIIQSITLIGLSLFVMSSSCDEGSEGCTEVGACNYNPDVGVDDGSCYFADTGFDCDQNCLLSWDCAGSCGGTSIVDVCGICCGGNTQFECVQNIENCPNCEGDQVLGCNGCADSLIVLDCDSVCGGEAELDECIQCFGGTTGAEENQDMGCDGICFSGNVLDVCGNCVGNDMDIGHSWRLNISAAATMSMFNTTVGSDSDSVVLGASVYAEDGWNIYNGDCPDGSANICYSDVVYPPINPPDNHIKFYFPHEDWDEDILELYGTTDIIQDIRNNDFTSLYTDGMVWNAIIKSKPDEVQIDSLFLHFEFIEGVEYGQIDVNINGIEYAVESSSKLELEIDSPNNLELIIRISNLCYFYVQ